MVFKMKDMYKQAMNQATEVLTKIGYTGGMVQTDDVVKYVGNESRNEINVFVADFAPLGKPIDECGALTAVRKMPSATEKGKIDIYLNDKYPTQRKRFSLVHELGHILTKKNNFSEGRAFASAHMKFDVVSLDENSIEGNTALENEQIANVFALSILVPKKEMLKYGSNESDVLCDVLGVTEDVVDTRFKLEQIVE